MRLKPAKVVKRHSTRFALGDAVETALKPIVSVVDKTLGTSLSTCNSCKKRKELLNKIHL